MNNTPDNLKLLVIFYSDIVDSTTVAATDNPKYIKNQIHNRKIHNTSCEKFNGKYIKELGDGSIMTFTNVLDAVKASIDILEEIISKCDYEIRIGIHAGDVMVESMDIQGQNVAIASRLQTMAGANEIYVSEIINFNILVHPNFQTSYIGNRNLKGILNPMKVYRIELASRELGVSFDEKGNAVLNIHPSIFFYYRFQDAFPGVRGTKLFIDPEEIAHRLSILLKTPLKFLSKENTVQNSEEPYVVLPIWWFRGGSGLPIEEFQFISANKFRIGNIEITPENMIAFDDQDGKYNFVYIQIRPEEPIFKKNIVDKDLDNDLKLGYKSRYEEYAIFKGFNITREEYDDGSANIDGRVIRLNGRAELRRRYTSKYNLLICTKYSIYNVTENNHYISQMMDKLLNSLDIESDIVKFYDSLEKTMPLYYYEDD